MLRQARERLPRCEFVQADLTHWAAPADADVLYSNATFQWVPDHLSVLKRLLAGLKSGGVLAVQMPDNTNEPSHVWMREVANEPQWKNVIPRAAFERADLPSPGDYYDALKPLCAQLEIWHTHYQHALAGPEAIAEWFKGTALAALCRSACARNSGRLFCRPISRGSRRPIRRDMTARCCCAFRACSSSPVDERYRA